MAAGGRSVGVNMGIFLPTGLLALAAVGWLAVALPRGLKLPRSPLELARSPPNPPRPSLLRFVEPRQLQLVLRVLRQLRPRPLFDQPLHQLRPELLIDRLAPLEQPEPEAALEPQLDSVFGSPVPVRFPANG